MQDLKFSKPIFLTAILLIILSSTNFAQNEWKPPTPRDKAKTIFAPKPTAGNNIFKGEGEKWLTNAILKLDGEESLLLDNEFINNYVSQIGKNLATYSTAPTVEYKFTVLSLSQPNAMSVGNGYVYITLGMLKMVENEDELVAVLAHEIGHDAFKHMPKTITRQLFWMKGKTKISSLEETENALQELLKKYEETPVATFGESILGFSRFDELEADKAAFYNLYKAGYNPIAVKNVFTRLKATEKDDLGKDYNMYQFLTLLMGTHPPNWQRETAISWESNFVKMPPKSEFYKNSSFDKMKEIVEKL